MDHEEVTAANRDAWELAAQKYEASLSDDIALLRSGGVSLFPAEREALGDLSGCRRAIHLQCSHGLDTLSLLRLGAREVVGVDASAWMLSIARRKAAALEAHAEWVHADVLDLPASLAGTADLVYTGKGALPWVPDLDRWAAGVRRLLRSGGKLLIFEGHPLNRVWRRAGSSHVLDATWGGYFDAEFRANADFPASAVSRFSPPGVAPPVARERQWTLGHVVTAVARAGLVAERLEERPEHYWPQFPEIAPSEMELLPHSYLLVARELRAAA